MKTKRNYHTRPTATKFQKDAEQAIRDSEPLDTKVKFLYDYDGKTVHQYRENEIITWTPVIEDDVVNLIASEKKYFSKV